MPYTATDSARAAELRKTKDELLANALRLLDGAKAEGREITSDEESAIEQAMTKVKAGDPERAELGRRMIAAVMGGDGDVDVDQWGESKSGPFTPEDSRGFLQAVKSRGMFRTEMPVKAALGSNTLLPTSGQGVVGGAYPNAAFALSELFTVEATSAPSVRYYVLGNATAALVAENAAKPDSGVTVTAKDVAVAKIATLCRFSDELSSDAAFLLQYLQAELVNAVITSENAVVVSALLGASGIGVSTGAATAVIDLAAAAAASLEALNGAPPAAIILHPSVVGTIRQAKASTSGAYFLDPTAPGPQTLHGVRVVASTATAAGTALLVGSGAATVFRRSALVAEIGYDGVDFSTNSRTLRVEERVAVGVVRPSMVHRITLT